MNRLEIHLEARPYSEAAKEWVRRHGLDPNRIAIPNVLTIDDEARTVSIEDYFEIDEDGLPVVDGDHVVTYPVVVQLEAPALPTPSSLKALEDHSAS